MTSTSLLFYILGVDSSATVQTGCITSPTTSLRIKPQTLKRRRLHFLKAHSLGVMVRCHAKRDIVTLFLSQPRLTNKRNISSAGRIRTGNGARPKIGNWSERSVFVWCGILLTCKSRLYQSFIVVLFALRRGIEFGQLFFR